MVTSTVKGALILLLLLHAAIHVMGFVKALDPSALPDLELGVSQAWGVVWLIAALLMGATAITSILEFRLWWALALVAALLSQVAIVAHFGDAKFGTIANVIVVAGALLAFGKWRFERSTDALVHRLDAAPPSAPSGSHPCELPLPVRRYLERVLPPGAPAIQRVVLEQEGTFNTSESEPAWKPFRATHVATTASPGFVWAADVRFAPGLSGFVHDSYVAHTGMLAPSLAGLLPLGTASDTGGDLARGELLRFLAEAAWYPTLLRDHPSLWWTAIDSTSAEAHLREGGVTVSLVFTFTDDGLIESVRAQSRPRLVEGKVVPTPWVGYWSDYEERGGVLIPLRGEVAWMLDGAPHTYWRGRVVGDPVLE